MPQNYECAEYSEPSSCEKALRGEGAHGALELLIQLIQGVLALAPGLRTKLRHWRPLFLRRELRAFSIESAEDQGCIHRSGEGRSPKCCERRLLDELRRLPPKHPPALRAPKAHARTRPEGSADLICDHLHIHGLTALLAAPLKMVPLCT